jgi:hydroxyacylglutathione hydrolase
MNRDKEDFLLKRLVLGPLATNCYLLSCNNTKEAAVIDPAEESDILLQLIDGNKLLLKYILNTHGHGDHIGGNKILKEKYSAKLLIHKLDEKMLIEPKKNFSFYTGMPVKSPPPDEYLEDGMTLKVGLLELFVIHTPGHSPGGVSIKVDAMIFTGDTLFKDSIGRTDLPGGSFPVLMNSIKEKLLVFDSSYEVLPGHGPATTLKQELNNNPWLKEE